MLETASLDHRSILVRESLPEILVEIRQDAVTGHRVTSFSPLLLERCRRQQSKSQIKILLSILICGPKMKMNNDDLNISSKNADVSKNNDVKGYTIIAKESSCVTL